MMVISCLECRRCSWLGCWPEYRKRYTDAFCRKKKPLLLLMIPFCLKICWYRKGRKLGKVAFAAGLLNPGWSEFVSHVKISHPDWDCLNLRRRGWRNLDFPEELRHDSVPELLHAARNETLRLIEIFEGMLQTGVVTSVDFPVNFDNGNAPIIIDNMKNAPCQKTGGIANELSR